MFGHGEIKKDILKLKSDMKWAEYDCSQNKASINTLWERINEIHNYLGVEGKTIPGKPAIPEHTALVKKSKKRK